MKRRSPKGGWSWSLIENGRPGQAAHTTAPQAREGEACPTCGATPEELDLVRRKRALDAIMLEYERHLSGCKECGGWAGPWCEAGRALRRRYLDAWLAWQSWRGGGVA